MFCKNYPIWRAVIYMPHREGWWEGIKIYLLISINFPLLPFDFPDETAISKQDLVSCVSSKELYDVCVQKYGRLIVLYKSEGDIQHK